MTVRRTDALNLYLLGAIVTRSLRPRSDPEAVEFLEHALSPDGSPEELYNYWYMLGLSWGIFTPVFGLLCVGLAYLLDKIAGDPGNRVGINIFIFVEAFGLTGCADAAWRTSLAHVASRRYQRTGDLDDRTGRLITLARLNDATPLLQLAVGLVFAWRFG
jgi:hypothetical protein